MVKCLRWIGLWILLESSAAFAGSLHYFYLELKDVPSQAGYAVAVLVTLVNASRRNIRLQARIKQRWGAVPESLSGKGDVEVTLNPGVEWVDPHESPIEPRVRGFLSEVKPNTEVVLIPFGGVYEALPYSPQMKRKLDLYFTPTGVEDYKKSGDVQALVRDLEDEDLGGLAHEVLVARKLLRAEQLLGLRWPLFHERVALHLRGSSVTERAAFLRETAHYFSGKPYDERAAQLLRLLFELPLEPAELPPLAELLDALDLRSEQANSDFGLLKDKLVERLKAPDAKSVAGLFVPAMVRFALHRPGHRSDDPGTAVFLSGLERPAQTRMVRELLSGTRAGGRFDYWLFTTAMSAAIAAPSRDYLPAFSALDLTQIAGTNWQVDALVKILKSALRLVEIEPDSIGAVRNAIDPLLQNQSILSFLNLTSPEGQALLERYRKLSRPR